MTNTDKKQSNDVVENASNEKKQSKLIKYWNKNKIDILAPLVAILTALIIGGIIIAFSGVNPFVAYGKMIQTAFYKATPKAPNMSGLAKTLLLATPMILGGLAVMFGFKVGLFNIGVQGQMVAGGIAATIVGVYVKNVLFGNFIVAIIAAGIAGFLWAGLAGFLKAKFGVHEVISTIMLNYIADFLLKYLLARRNTGSSSFFSKYMFYGFLNDPTSSNAQSPAVHKAARLFKIAPSTKQSLNFGFIIAILATVLIWYFFKNVKKGYQMKAVGLNPTSSENAGIKISRNIVLAMGISGILAGIAGAERVLGGVANYVSNEQLMGDLGFTGIAVALLGKNTPFGILFAGIFYAALEIGGQALQNMKLQKEIVYIIQALLIIFVAGENFFRNFLVKFMSKRREK